ncbi:MAG: cytochrome c oxidase subunit II [Nocardioidaceae bacterium]|nr:cytochrome c oxidase subunit II [Nocardioidaceae bacterium]
MADREALTLSWQLPARARRIGFAGLTAVALMMLASCSTADQEELKRLAEPEGVTDRSGTLHSLWIWSWVAAILVGILVWGLILYACWRYRRRRDDEVPVQTRYNLPIEILYTVAPVIMVLVFFFYTVKAQDVALADPPGGKADHVVTVVGQQWSWTFNYDKDSALDGSTTVFDAGTTADKPTLYLPVDESVLFKLRSPDVIHDFWVPSFLMKMDVVPGRENSFSLTPTREGTYVGRCAELCGAYHSRMLFDVKVVSADDYAAHLQKLQQEGNIGPALGGSDATTQKGLEGNENGAGE